MLFQWVDVVVICLLSPFFLALLVVKMKRLPPNTYYPAKILVFTSLILLISDVSLRFFGVVMGISPSVTSWPIDLSVLIALFLFGLVLSVIAWRK